MLVTYHSNFAEDLEALWGRDPKAAAVVAVVVQEVAADLAVIDKLTQHGDNRIGSHVLGVKRWEKVRNPRQGDLWRFRIFNTPATIYRVVYGYHYQTRQIHLLGIAAKADFDYELDSDHAKRLLSAWKGI